MSRQAVLLLWLLCPAVAAPQSPPHPQEPPVQESASIHRDSCYHHRTAPTHCPPNQQHSANTASEQGDEKMAPDWMAILTGGLLGVAFLQLVMIGIQIWVTVRQLRAYVFAGKGTMHTPFSEEGGWVEVLIANRGQTPAYDATVARDTVLLDSDADYPPRIQDDRFTPFGSMGPGGEIGMRVPLLAFRPDQVAALRAGEKHLYVFGEVRYRDAFRKKRFSQFCFVFGGHYGMGEGPLAIARNGNKAD
jgi:hypothetical protein